MLILLLSLYEVCLAIWLLILVTMQDIGQFFLEIS